MSISDLPGSTERLGPPFSNHQQRVGETVCQEAGSADVSLHGREELGTRRLRPVKGAAPIGQAQPSGKVDDEMAEVVAQGAGTHDPDVAQAGAGGPLGELLSRERDLIDVARLTAELLPSPDTGVEQKRPAVGDPQEGKPPRSENPGVSFEDRLSIFSEKMLGGAEGHG